MLRFATVSLVALATAMPVMANEVNVYSSRHYDTDLALYDKFTEETGITINLIEGSGDELQARLEAEGANSPADVFITVDGGRLHRAVEANLFQPIQSDVLEARVPEKAQHPDNLWFGLTSRARVIFYNIEAGLPEGVSDYEDLANPDLEGMICIRTSSNIYNVSLMAEIIDAVGEEAAEQWAAGLANNLARSPQGGDTDQLRALAAGECRLAVSNTYYWGSLKASSNPEDVATADKVAFIYPNQDNRGAHVNISGAGVVANAPNFDNAVTFLEYLVADEAQKILADGNNEFPIVEGVAFDGPISAFTDFTASDVNVSIYGINAAAATAVYDRAGMP